MSHADLAINDLELQNLATMAPIRRDVWILGRREALAKRGGVSLCAEAREVLAKHDARYDVDGRLRG